MSHFMSTNRSSLKVHTVPLMYPNKAAERTVILHTAHVTYRPVCDVVFIGGANGVLLPLLELLWEESWSYHERLRAKRERAQLLGFETRRALTRSTHRLSLSYSTLYFLSRSLHHHLLHAFITPLRAASSHLRCTCLSHVSVWMQVCSCAPLLTESLSLLDTCRELFAYLPTFRCKNTGGFIVT